MSKYTKRGKSRIATLKPGKKGVRLKGVLYKPTVFRIEDHYDDGRIKTCTMIHDDQTVSLEDETKRAFLVAFVNEDMVDRKAN